MKIEYQELYEDIFTTLKESDVKTKAPAFLNSSDGWELIKTFLNEFSMFMVMLISVDGQPTVEEMAFVTQLARTRLNKETVLHIAKEEDFFGTGDFISTVPETLKVIINKDIIGADKYLELYIRAGRDLINLGQGKSKDKQSQVLRTYYRVMWRYIRRNTSKEMIKSCREMMAVYGVKTDERDEAFIIGGEPKPKDSPANDETPVSKDSGTRLELTNMDVRAYRVKQLPYHFILFHHIPMAKFFMYKKTFGGRDEDNALLTYCYLDTQAGLSYRVMCCAKLYDDGRVDYNVPETITTAMIMREGTLECPAEIINEGAEGMERFQKEADSIKDNYGYLRDRVEIHDDVPFDEHRHPAYPDDIMVQFFTPDKKRELMWVREQSRQGNSVIGRLIDEPFNPLVGLHNGDSVEVVPHEFDDGEVIPVAVLPWMKQG